MRPGEILSGKALELVPRLLGPPVAPTEVCPRCRLPGRHAGPDECIEALRDRIACLQFHKEAVHEKVAADGVAAERRGGRRERRDNRFVLLGGERVTLTEAGRRLNISPGALVSRIRNRIGDADYSGIDLDVIGADRAAGGAATREAADPRTFP